MGVGMDVYGVSRCSGKMMFERNAKPKVVRAVCDIVSATSYYRTKNRSIMGMRAWTALVLF